MIFGSKNRISRPFECLVEATENQISQETTKAARAAFFYLCVAPKHTVTHKKNIQKT
jgi:hypothetical protein